jgi:hypothetical protein
MPETRSMECSTARRPATARAWALLGRAAAFAVVGAAMIAFLAFVPARGNAQGLGIGLAGGLNLPVGDLGNSSDLGIGLSLRRESGSGSVGWGMRTDFSFDRFGAKGPSIDNYQYIGFTTNLVHHTNPQLYQFGGIGLFQAKTVMKRAGLGLGGSDTENAFGIQGGVGLSLPQISDKAFLEVGVVTVLTSGRSSSWFPVRFGFKL